MNPIPVNLLAVLVGGLISMVLGTVWYGPLFGKAWMKELGLKKSEAKGSVFQYGAMFVAALVTSYVLNVALLFGEKYTMIVGPMAGVMVAFYYWLGFVAPAMLGKVLWEKKSWTLWFIDSGYYLVYMMVVGVMMALWM